MSRSVLITGGSSGIGRATVERFARQGDRVWFTYRSGRERALATVAELAGRGWQVEAFEFDQGNWPSHECLFLQLPGPVEVLVNNVVLNSRAVERYPAGSLSEQAVAAAFLRINSLGPLWLIQQVLPEMLDRGYGKIINISGAGAHCGLHAAEGMSKAAIAYLTRHLAAELVHQPIDVFAICPGAVQTPGPEEGAPVQLSVPRWHELEAGPPQGRLIQPAEIAELVWWLTTAAAQMLHGSVIDASMGLEAHPGSFPGRGVGAREGLRATEDDMGVA